MASRVSFLFAVMLAVALSGCSALPDVRSEPRFHNPFPQLQRVAVLPFANQSQEPTLDTRRVTIAYHNELQKLPGFEVKPPGVVRTELQALGIELNQGTDFQALAQHLDVDVVIVGAVTEFTPYYPPRMAMRVHWYAANPGFHPIPAGYGLPWGTAEEEYIPDSIVHDAEFALAREQLKTQTPDYPKAKYPQQRPYPGREGARPNEELPRPPHNMQSQPPVDPSGLEATNANYQSPTASRANTGAGSDRPHEDGDVQPANATAGVGAMHPIQGCGHPSCKGRGCGRPGCLPIGAGPMAGYGPGGYGPPGYGQLPLPEPSPLPPDWPDPGGFVPEGPQPSRPKLLPQSKPIITHTRLYDGTDEQFTRRVAEYFYFRDDARFGGWQAYLQRSEDFINVCCHFHITETLAARGGAGKSRVVWRWPIDRYER